MKARIHYRKSIQGFIRNLEDYAKEPHSHVITHSTIANYLGFKIKDNTKKIQGRGEEQRFNAMFAKQKKKKVSSVRKNMGKENKKTPTQQAYCMGK